MFAVPLMLFFVAVLLFIALLQRQRELAVLCLTTTGIMAAAYWWSRVSLMATDVDIFTDKHRLFPNEQLHINIVATNAKALPVYLTVLPALSGRLFPDRDGGLESKSSGLLGYQKASFDWRLTVGPRGVYAVGPLRLTSGDLFGFFPRQAVLAARSEVIVYPRLVPLRPVAFTREEAFGTPGGHGPVNDPVHILGTRDYQPFEPARQIHWKASARHRKLQSKVFAPSRQEKTLLMLDACGYARLMDETLFERVLEVIASVAERMDRAGSAVGLFSNAQLNGPARTILPPARNPHQISRILETLARSRMSAEDDLLNVIRHSAPVHRATGCALFTHRLDREAELLSAFFSRSRIRLKIFTSDKATALREDDISTE